ncbi:MAG: LacI family DNA-binding transcriptional regulator [Candidatus Methylacidiphilales bacterium]|nr:LacI family DNA-binding transcriptional regulator [Candidatus Methylacidiphilales bacterium]
MKNRISIRDIAREVGVHHTTVSLALRGSPLLKAETREKIQAAAARLGYAPDPMLTALTAYRQSKRPNSFHAVIAWINNWPNRKGLLTVPTYRGYYEGAHACATKLGYALQEFWLHEKEISPGKLRQILNARSITGLLIAPQPPNPRDIGINLQDFSAVAFGYSTQPLTQHLVTNHHSQTLDLIVAKLVELGYRRPGYCIPPSSDIGGNYIWISRMLYLYSLHPSLEKIPRVESLDKEAVAAWLATYKPDVIIGFSYLVPEVEAMGYRIPHDIGFASVAVDTQDPRVSGANENDFLIGDIAVKFLVGMMHRGERGVPEVPIRTLVDSSWFPGETLREKA